MNRTIFQYFHWYNTPEENLWKKVAKEAKHLAELGITEVWLPPAYKSAKGVDEPGYAVYDLYDLGEFDQKGTVRTKYGTKQEYLEAIKALQDAGLKVLADVVLNHKMGGDEKEKVKVVSVNADSRKETVGAPAFVETNSKFTFPGRNGKYSNYVWDQYSFSGYKEGEDIKLILNDQTNGEWDEVMTDEMGSYDYLLGIDVNFRNPFVREELKRWGVWYVETTGVDGFRLDGLKHINPDFFPEWLAFLDGYFKKEFKVVGEFWKQDVKILNQFLEITDGRIPLFDVPLHFNFHKASKEKEEYDMSSILNDTLIELMPDKAVTFVENHDTQPMQALESSVDIWFKPLAGAIIALRQEGVPCVSYPALYGAQYKDEKEGEEIEVELESVALLPTLLRARQNFAYGTQRDYFDHKNVVGWTREGVREMENSGIAVLVNNADEGEKRMSMGEVNSGRILVDVSGNKMPDVILDDKGEGIFSVGKESVAIYVDEKVKERFVS